MRKVSFHIEKGGTGKTTLAGNIAFEMRHYHKTIMLDCDPQANLTSWFATDSLQWEMADVLQGKCTLQDAIIQIRDNLYLLPTFAIDGNLKLYGETTLFQQPYAFHDLTDKIQALGFEIAIFDLGPGISNLEKSILSVCDEVVGVTAAEYFSFDGLEVFEHELQKLRTERRAVYTVNKLVVNKVNQSFALHKVYQDRFNELPYKLYHVGQSRGIADCVPYHQSMFEYDEGNRNTSELQRLAQDVRQVEYAST